MQQRHYYYSYRTIAALGAIVALAATSAEAQSIGRWRLPSTLAQASGFCYGPGHHAPIVVARGYPVPPAPRTVVVPGCESAFCTEPYRDIRGCGPAGCGGYGMTYQGSSYGGGYGEGVRYDDGPSLTMPEEAGMSLGAPPLDRPHLAPPAMQPTLPNPRATPAPRPEPLPLPSDRSAWMRAW
ncbi:MAG: hypothetical protein KF688_02620 [Pirellulales bacterium]|nr:hypothetical protein [Pirellulales bacterium]